MRVLGLIPLIFGRGDLLPLVGYDCAALAVKLDATGEALSPPMWIHSRFSPGRGWLQSY